MAKIKFSKKKIMWSLLIIFLLIQFKRIDKTEPEIVPENDLLILSQAPTNIGESFKSACYDCHSNETNYPWYSNVAPFSWWLKGHIDHARGNLNYSDWGEMSVSEQAHAIKESIDMIDKEWMPIASYKIMHSDSRLTRDQREDMITWLEQIQE